MTPEHSSTSLSLIRATAQHPPGPAAGLAPGTLTEQLSALTDAVAKLPDVRVGGWAVEGPGGYWSLYPRDRSLHGLLAWARYLSRVWPYRVEVWRNVADRVMVTVFGQMTLIGRVVVQADPPGVEDWPDGWLSVADLEARVQDTASLARGWCSR